MGRKWAWAAAIAAAALLATAYYSTVGRSSGTPSAAPEDSAPVDPSRAFMPKPLEGLQLGMGRDALLRARPRAERTPRMDEPGLEYFQEPLEGRGRALYAFDAGAGGLRKLQVASRLAGPAAIEPYLGELVQRYGRPGGVWDCPGRRGGPLATRRLTWHRSEAGLMVNVLLLGERVAVTRYVAPLKDVARSLRGSGCRPMPEGDFARFPSAGPPPDGGR